MCLLTILRSSTGRRCMRTLLSTIRPRDITPQEWQFLLALAWPWEQCGAAVGVGMPAGGATTSRSTTTTISTVMRTSTATSVRIAVVLGSTIRNIAAAHPIGTERLPIDLGVRHAEIPWPTDRLVPANKSASRAAISVIGLRAERPPARGLPQAEPTPWEAGISRAVVAAVRMPSAGDPEDSMDPALVPLVVVVPPAWDREVAASVAAGGGGKSPR